MFLRNVMGAGTLCCMSILLFSCASAGQYGKIDTFVERGQYAEALNAIDSAQVPVKEKNRLLQAAVFFSNR